VDGSINAAVNGAWDRAQSEAFLVPDRGLSRRGTDVLATGVSWVAPISEAGRLCVPFVPFKGGRPFCADGLTATS